MAKAEASEEKAVKKAKGGGSMVTILLIVQSVLLMAGLGLMTMIYLGGSSGDHAGSEVSAAGEHGEGVEGEDGEVKKEASYFAFDPAFIVNYTDNEEIRYLQLTIEVMSRDAEAIVEVEKHMPIIRNNIILMLSGQTYDSLSSVEGKQKLREQALKEVQDILTAETGSPGVDDLYFTSFVMQ